MILTIEDQEEFFSFPFDDDLIMQVSSTDSGMLLVTVYTNNKGMPERHFFGHNSGITTKDYKFMINAIKEAYKQKSKQLTEIINLNELFELEKNKKSLSKELDVLLNTNNTKNTLSNVNEDEYSDLSNDDNTSNEDDDLELDDYDDYGDNDDDYVGLDESDDYDDYDVDDDLLDM